MKVLVTGGAGFIGSNLCEALLKQGHKVKCLDNFSTGQIKNLLSLLEEYPETFQLQLGDIRNMEDCRKAVKDMEYVLHEAALGSVPRSINDPVTSNDVNVGGFINMLVASKDEGIKRFVFASSSSVYGDDTSLPKVEDVVGNQLSPYAITKYVNELYAAVFAQLYGMEYIGLRYFNVFGRRQNPDATYAAVIPIFVKQLMKHESPLVNGDGEYSRDFTYIDNVIQMNLLALTTTNPEAVNQIYNTAFGERMSLNELTGFLKDYLSKVDPAIADIEIKYGPNRTGDIPHTLASIDKAKRLLGYEPQYSICSGLQKTMKWYMESMI